MQRCMGAAARGRGWVLLCLWAHGLRRSPALSNALAQKIERDGCSSWTWKPRHPAGTRMDENARSPRPTGRIVSCHYLSGQSETFGRGLSQVTRFYGKKTTFMSSWTSRWGGNLSDFNGENFPAEGPRQVSLGRRIQKPGWCACETAAATGLVAIIKRFHDDASRVVAWLRASSLVPRLVEAESARARARPGG